MCEYTTLSTFPSTNEDHVCEGGSVSWGEASWTWQPPSRNHRSMLYRWFTINILMWKDLNIAFISLLSTFTDPSNSLHLSPSGKETLDLSSPDRNISKFHGIRDRKTCSLGLYKEVEGRGETFRSWITNEVSSSAGQDRCRRTTDR